MKYINIKIISILILLAVTYFSCNKNNLDLKPLQPTESDYFSTELEFTKTVYGIYAKLTDYYWYNGGQDNCALPVQILPGDDITTPAKEEFEYFTSLNPSSSRLQYFYKTCYQLIGRSNVLLQKNSAVATGIYTTANLKNYHRGEALFLRSLGYYHLWNIFGTAPLVTERIQSSDKLSPGNSKKTELLDQAIIDLKEAATLLPLNWDVNNKGRATSNSANGLLGKCLVFRANATKSTEDYQSAITAFNAISGISLVAKFDDNFAADTENNPESLFEFQATQANFDNVWLANDFDPNNQVGSMSSFWGLYDTNNFALFGKSPFVATGKLVNIFDTKDPRRDLTLDSASRSIKKYLARGKSTNSGVASADNPRILRYADVLLLKAEAILQSGGAASEAIGLINQVRSRARAMVGGGTFPADLSTAESNKTTIMQWIMDERLRELAGEGQRWYDIKRWHIAGFITLNNNFFSSANSALIGFDPNKHINFPIPINETDLNTNIVQNPGY